MTYRAQMPWLVAPRCRASGGRPDYSGPPMVSLHQTLRGGLGLKLGDKLTFDIFGDQVTAEVANFRDYSWQGGIDFLATFAPGVLEGYPATLLGAVTAAPGRERSVDPPAGHDLPDVRFIAIGETLTLITAALSQLSLAASLVGGLAVGNGLLVLLGSLAMGRPPTAPGRCGDHQGAGGASARNLLGVGGPLRAAGNVRSGTRDSPGHRACMDIDHGAARCGVHR